MPFIKKHSKQTERITKRRLRTGAASSYFLVELVGEYERFFLFLLSSSASAHILSCQRHWFGLPAHRNVLHILLSPQSVS